MLDPYSVLEVSPDADDQTVKKAYRQLSKQYHPDNNINNPYKEQAEEKFKMIQMAYEQIMDERSRGIRGNSYGSSAGHNSYNNYDYYQRQSNNNRTSRSSGSGSRYNQGSNSRTGYNGNNSYTGNTGYTGNNGYTGNTGYTGNNGYSRTYTWNGNRQNYTANSERYTTKTEQDFATATAFINNCCFKEALDVLNKMDVRNDLWYYLSSVANLGMGNNVTALDQAKMAYAMKPANEDYAKLVSGIEDGTYRYRNRNNNYRPQAVVPKNNLGIKIFLCFIFANLFCGGGGFLCSWKWLLCI